MSASSGSSELQPGSSPPTPAPSGLLGLLAARRRKKHEQRLQREARLLLGEVRSGLDRSEQGQLGASLRSELEADAGALDKALASGDRAGVCRGIAALDDRADRHLGFARKSTLREYAESIAIAVLFALLLRAFVVEAFKIPSGSMIPTLEVGDHIFVNKYIYGVRIPWTKTRFFTWRKPKRGEIIVFMYPENPSQDFIKRVVAVGGDTLEVRDNQLVINGVLQPRQEVEHTCSYTDYNKDLGAWSYHKPCELFRERLGPHVFYTMNLPNPGHLEYRNYPCASIPNPHQCVLHGEEAFRDDPSVDLSPAEVRAAEDGQPIKLSEHDAAALTDLYNQQVENARQMGGDEHVHLNGRMRDPQGNLIAVGEFSPTDGSLHPTTIMAKDKAFLAGVHKTGESFITVPEGQVYVMGDNRDDSHDSRYWGGVPLETIKGKALIVWWSMGEHLTLDRLGRIGKLIY